MAKSYLSQPNLPLGISNNNPGNLVWSANNNWEGQLGSDANGFAVFSDIDYGIRAMALNAINIIHNNNDTLTNYITTYAPPSANDTQSYINYVAQETGINPATPLNQILDGPLLLSLLRAQIQLENASNATSLVSSSPLITDQDISTSINLLPALILQEVEQVVATPAGGAGVLLLVSLIGYGIYKFFK